MQTEKAAEEPRPAPMGRAERRVKVCAGLQAKLVSKSVREARQKENLPLALGEVHVEVEECLGGLDGSGLDVVDVLVGKEGQELRVGNRVGARGF